MIARLTLFIVVMLTACSSVSDSAHRTSGPSPLYRYENTINLGNDLTMDKVTVEGFDDEGLREVTRLVVRVNQQSLTLRGGGAMYTPKVEEVNGQLVVSWMAIGETLTKVTLSYIGGVLKETARVSR